MEQHGKHKLEASPEDFVRVQGNGFVLGANNTPFKFIGCNSYVLLVSACGEHIHTQRSLSGMTAVSRVHNLQGWLVDRQLVSDLLLTGVLILQRKMPAGSSP